MFSQNRYFTEYLLSGIRDKESLRALLGNENIVRFLFIEAKYIRYRTIAGLISFGTDSDRQLADNLIQFLYSESNLIDLSCIFEHTYVYPYNTLYVLKYVDKISNAAVRAGNIVYCLGILIYEERKLNKTLISQEEKDALLISCFEDLLNQEVIDNSYAFSHLLSNLVLVSTGISLSISSKYFKILMQNFKTKPELLEDIFVPLFDSKYYDFLRSIQALYLDSFVNDNHEIKEFLFKASSTPPINYIIKAYMDKNYVLFDELMLLLLSNQNDTVSKNIDSVFGRITVSGSQYKLFLKYLDCAQTELVQKTILLKIIDFL